MKSLRNFIVMNNFLRFSLCVLLSFFFLLISNTSLVASSFSPIDHYLVSCASNQPTILDSDHRIFTSDSASRFLKTSSTRTIQLIDRDDSTLPDQLSPIYRTARAFKRPSKYVFGIKDQGTHHLVRLHFRPFNNINNSTCSDFSAAHFHVLANGFLLLRDFRVEISQKDVIIKEYIMRVGSEKLEITFVPAKRSNFAFVNAIEVISAPKDLIADLAQFVGSERNERISGLLKNGFETVYRVSVGGPKVTPFNDSLWRTWVPDDEYLKLSGGSLRIQFGGRINYQLGGASREVGPDNVYSSARVIKSLNDSIPATNMTWIFPGIDDYKYLVRVHFCDIASAAINLLYFNVYVNGNLAYENLDLSAMTSMMLGSPFYADFVVDGGSSGDLTVSVGPSKVSLPRAVDGILNGVEIFKISNEMDSFSGKVCAESVIKRWRSGNYGALVFVLAAAFVLLTASVVVQRRRTEARETVGFSRLPVDVSEVNLKSDNQSPSVKL